jgi:hypothetical protein
VWDRGAEAIAAATIRRALIEGRPRRGRRRRFRTVRGAAEGIVEARC